MLIKLSSAEKNIILHSLNCLVHHLVNNKKCETPLYKETIELCKKIQK